MKLNELRQIIREEISKVRLNENSNPYIDKYLEGQKIIHRDKNKYEIFKSYLSDLGYDIDRSYFGPYSNNIKKTGQTTHGIMSLHPEDRTISKFFTPKETINNVNKALEHAGIVGVKLVVSPTYGFRVKAI
jgi:hypothetical protein